jgi:hypothetical protein
MLSNDRLFTVVWNIMIHPEPEYGLVNMVTSFVFLKQHVDLQW